MNTLPHLVDTNERAVWSVPRLLQLGDTANVMGGGQAASDGSSPDTAPPTTPAAS